MLHLGWFPSHLYQSIMFLCQILKQIDSTCVLPPRKSILDDTRTAHGIGAAKLTRSEYESWKLLQTPHSLLLRFHRLKLPGQSWNEMILDSLAALLHPVANELSTPLFFKVLSQTHVSALDKVYLWWKSILAPEITLSINKNCMAHFTFLPIPRSPHWYREQTSYTCSLT